MLPSKGRSLCGRWVARLRTALRSNEFFLIPVALIIGCVTGIAVALMTWAAHAAHVVIYGIPIDLHLSASASVEPATALIAPALGGLILGLMEWSRRRLNIPNATDPVEANALRGGYMSLRDSFVVGTQTLISNGCGASVGLEAGFTQIGSGSASLIGRWLNLRRSDLRLMVGCGAAGAIAAAFNAPLTGAFYACELIVGAYSVASAAPILTASIAAAYLASQMSGAPYLLEVSSVASGSISQSIALFALAVLVGLIGIATMKACAIAERGFDRPWLPIWLRPVLGGLCVGGMAIATPQVLAAGHGAMLLDLNTAMPAMLIAGLIALKLSACIISLASGFRGGLFFASLFVGSLIGKLFGVLFSHLGPAIGLDLDVMVAALTGMAAFGVAIVGSPLTMTFLVLEMTHNFYVTATVLAACLVSSIVVRGLFGHTFSTWRLYLRGQTIRSADDVGWVRDLTVGSMMRTDLTAVPASATIAECRSRYGPGTQRALFVVDDHGVYRGVVSLPDLFVNAFEGRSGEATISSLAKHSNVVLTSTMTIAAAINFFKESEGDVLAVVDNNNSDNLIGFVTESYVYRRFIEEMSRSSPRTS